MNTRRTPSVPGTQAALPSRKWLTFAGRPFTLSEGNLFLLLAIVIGVLSGLAVVAFRASIEWVRLGLLGSGLTPSPLRVLLAPALAGLVVAFLVQKFFPAARGSGQTKRDAESAAASTLLEQLAKQ